jgi:hypothetical protein
MRTLFVDRKVDPVVKRLIMLWDDTRITPDPLHIRMASRNAASVEEM